MAEIRIQKFLSDAGVVSRRAAEREILRGGVRVNGLPAEIGQKIDPERDTVEYCGRIVKADFKRYVYIMLNKPRGYVTTLSDERGRKTVAELVSDAGRRLYPVGRLDLNSEGLLIMTDDGEAANALMHPAHDVEKTYNVTVSGRVTPRQISAMESLRAVNGKPIRQARIKLLGSGETSSRLRFVIHEGRNRQVRRMCESVGLTVTRLVRVSEGELKLGRLPSGRWRELTRPEMEYIKALIGANR